MQPEEENLESALTSSMTPRNDCSSGLLRAPVHLPRAPVVGQQNICNPNGSAELCCHGAVRKISCAVTRSSLNYVHCTAHLVILEVEERDNIVAVQNLD